MPAMYDAVVIGATISGLTSALTLARRGAKTVVLDPFPDGASASVGHGVATVALGDDLAVGRTSDETLLRRLGRVLDAQSFIAGLAESHGVPIARMPLVERTLAHDPHLAVERRMLVRLGASVTPVPADSVAGLDLGPGFMVPDQLVVDPAAYAAALRRAATEAGVTLMHLVTVTRLRRHRVLYAVHYRSQLAWEHSMQVEWAPRVIDTQATSPWGRHVRQGQALSVPVVLTSGITLDAVLALRDTPARLLRPYRDGVLAVGHPVPPAALETATLGLRQWVSERLGAPASVTSSYGIEPGSLENPSEGASPIPGGFWAGGNGLWELARGTAAGLAIARRLLSDPDAEQRLPAAFRLRALLRRGWQGHSR